MAEHGRGGPPVDEIRDGLGKIGALVDDPAYGAGEDRGWGEQAGAEGGVGTGASEDVGGWRTGWRILDFICRVG